MLNCWKVWKFGNLGQKACWLKKSAALFSSHPKIMHTLQLVSAVVTATSARLDVVREVLNEFLFCKKELIKAATELRRIDLDILKVLLDWAKVKVWSSPFEDKNYAIHCAAMHCESVEAIQMWIAASPPGGLALKNSSGQLPLHLAARHNKSVDVVRTLCVAHPEGIISVVDKLGRLPLLMAVISCGGEIVLALLDAYPEGARTACKGVFPLHHATSTDMSAHALCALISAYPEAAGVKVSSGKLPIHRAARFCKSAEVMRDLIAAYPDGVSSWDSEGQLPIHIAARYSTSAEVVHVLIEAYPESLAVDDRKDNNLPLHICAKHFDYVSGRDDESASRPWMRCSVSS